MKRFLLLFVVPSFVIVNALRLLGFSGTTFFMLLTIAGATHGAAITLIELRRGRPLL
jgi:hypothetical protein